MILTSCYDNIDHRDKFKYQVVSISGDRGKGRKYNGTCYPDLAPKKSFWLKWEANEGKLSPEENNKYYIREFYHQVLSKLDVNKVYEELDNKILLCYEQPDEFCHRQIVAAWFELFLGIEVPEVVVEKIDNLNNEEALTDERIKVVRARRNAIKDYLEEVITSSIDMKGFNTLYALNLYNKGEELERKAQNNSDIELAKELQKMAFLEANVKRNTLK